MAKKYVQFGSQGADVSGVPPDMYRTWVNKGAMNVGWFERRLNDEWRAGWALHTVFEQAGNTVVVLQRRSPLTG